MSDMKAWIETRTAPNGERYDVRLLLTDAEAKHLQAVGAVGPLWRIVGMQEVADATVAKYEKEAHTACGGVVQ